MDLLLKLQVLALDLHLSKSRNSGTLKTGNESLQKNNLNFKIYLRYLKHPYLDSSQAGSDDIEL